jgi:hypothetical protein
VHDHVATVLFVLADRLYILDPMALSFWQILGLTQLFAHNHQEKEYRKQQLHLHELVKV